MARYRVIKAHDGLSVGTIKELAESAIVDYMLKNGYWEVIDEGAAPAAIETKVVKPTETKKRKK